MSFVSLEYIIFLLVFLALYYVMPKKLKWIVLLIANIVFYYVSSGVLILFLIFSVLSVYSGALIINREKLKTSLISNELEKNERKLLKKKYKNNQKSVLTFVIILNFLILIVLKYSGFLIGNVNLIFNALDIEKLNVVNYILPLGISYYTLMSISYIVDVYREKIEVEENIFKLFVYLSFFPQMVEGPIVNYNDTANELFTPHKFDYDKFIKGFILIILGFLKKLVIADRCGLFVDTVFNVESNSTGIILFLGAVLYTLQIYAEFEGCMNIVSGSALLFGVEMPENFRRPFFSRSIQEFWRRWHITLGAWIKEYVFYPVSLSNFNTKITDFFKNNFPKFIANFVVVAFPLLFVWLFNGFWHGASYKYVAYGLYYYMLIMIGIVLSPLLTKIRSIFKIKKENIVFRIYEIIRTTIFVIFGMMLFRSHSFMTFIGYLKKLFISSNLCIFDFNLSNIDFIIIIIYIIVLLVVGIFAEKGKSLYDGINKLHPIIKILIFSIIVFLIIIFGIYGAGYDSANFIYGQF